MQNPADGDHKLRPLKLSTIAISTVVLVEVTLGLAVNSLAIVSDGLHATLDAVTMVVLFLTTRASLKPPDEEHMYGHEKFESIGGLVGGIALVGIALLIMYEAILRIVQQKTINLGLEYVGWIAIGYTLCIDFFRVRTLRKARESESSTMKAGFYHAVADLSSTVIALLGFGLATLGFGYGDSLASMVLSLLLSFMSVKLVWSSGMELSDTASRELTERVRKEILSTKGIYKYKNLRVRKAGTKTFAETTIQVPDYMSLEEAHVLASEIEKNIKNSLGNAEVTIHIEPPESETPTQKVVERLATEVEGVKEAHEISTAYTDGKLYVTLHACVDPDLSVEEAHEKAERIEKRIEKGIKDVENVTVHIEPFDAKRKKGSALNEDEIRRIVRQSAELWREAFRIKRIVTYVADKKRYINIDCCFTKQISVEDAHSISSQIEENLRKHFAETIVTVHMESDKE